MYIRTVEGIDFRIVIPFNVLEKTSLDSLHREAKVMEELNGAMKLLTNAQNDNPRFCISLDGYLHRLGIYQDRDKKGNISYHIDIWDIGGFMSLYSKPIRVEEIKHKTLGFEIPVISKEQMNEIKNKLRAWTRDKSVSCAICGEPHNNLGNFWFASTYCEKCWPKVKSKALAETYE